MFKRGLLYQDYKVVWWWPQGGTALSAGEVANMVRGSDLEGPLFEYQRKGNQVSLVERVPVEGRDAWRLRIQDAAGDSSYRYLDCETALEVRWDGWIMNGPTPVGVRSFFRDWRLTDGVMVAYPCRRARRR